MKCSGLIICAAFVLTCSSFGCLQYHHTAYRDCLQRVEHNDVPAPVRAKIHVFLMNGLLPLAGPGMKDLEAGLIEKGFPKVYYAQRLDRAWYYKEIHRLHREDAEYRFFLIGQGAAADEMQKLATALTADGILLDGVVFLDPIGEAVECPTETAVPVRIIRSHQNRGLPQLAATDSVSIANIGTYTLPKHPQTLAAIVDLLQASARGIPFVVEPVDCIPLTDEPRAIPRPKEPKTLPAVPGKWASVICPNLGQ